MGAEPVTRPPGSFHALGERLLVDSFPSIGREAVARYLSRADARIRRAGQACPGPAAPRPAVPAAAPRPVTLIVDDDEDLRDIMRRMLERRGFRTLTASAADEALRVCRDHPGAIDFVVADLGLPGVAGREFRCALAAARPRLRMIFMSGLPRETAVRSGLIAADDILMSKPFSPESLAAFLAAPAERRIP